MNRLIATAERCVAWAAVALCAACASLPPPPPKPVSQAWAQPEATALGALAAAAAPNLRFSGFQLLASGEDALAALAALADHAQRTLDLQYYLMRDDASTRALLRHVHAAAQRGVRVRVLLDDLNTAGADDALLCLTRHPQIEIRLYNPFPAGRGSTLTRVLASIRDVRRINQRMHNKMFVADNAIAVTGGRNLGDAYFVQSLASNFVDLDVIAAGPVVRDLSASFDRFWNSDLAYPLRTLVTKDPDCAGPLAASPPSPNGQRAAAAAQAVSTPEAPSGLPPADSPPARASVEIPDSTFAQELGAGRLPLAWVPAAVLADAPSKIASEGDPNRSDTIADDIVTLTRAARREVVLISPYFVPGKRGVALARELHARGVQLRVLTNSLAATDAPIVHIGYARYRGDLLSAGAELYELRSRLGAPRSRLGSFGSSLASLHAKALVIDRRLLLIGSMNMDPRSARLNTEIALVMRSPALAAQVVQLFDDVAASSSYRVEALADGRLRWVGQAPGAPTVEGSEPDAGVGLQFLLRLLSPFAPDELL
ncbi:MAG: phospholipase D family protein [Burkholderiaceae bacterium]|nr:phospholipase D family protein [Burkholderiaceae bacterium]